MSHLYRRGQIYWLAFYKDAKLYRQSLHTKDRSTAKYHQNKKERELIENISVAPNQHRQCEALLKDYISFHEHRKAKSSNLNSQEKIKAFLAWANITQIDQITERKFQEYLNFRVNKEGLSFHTVNHIIAIIKAWLNYAVRMRYIFENPLTRVKKYNPPKNPKRFLSIEEINKVLATAKDPKLYTDGTPTLYPIIATAIYTGMRKTELFNLEWHNIDFKNNVVSVVNKTGFMTKSKKFRIIDLHPELRLILEPLKKQEGLCFDTTNWRRIFRRILEKSELRKTGWHTFRHTFASHLVMAGVDLTSVATLLGHSTIKTTATYSHLSRDHLKDAVNKLPF